MADNFDSDGLAASADELSADEAAAVSAETDAALAMRARDGAEDAFAELFARHKRRVALIAGRFFRRHEQIEEAVQETFTKAYFALGDFSERAGASFAGWLARIAFNVCYDELRRQKRQPAEALGETDEATAAWLKERVQSAAADNAPPLSLEDNAVARDLTEKLLSRLSPEDRFVLTMLEVEGLSVAEIAAQMNWSSAKVKVRAHRARGALRKVLGKFL